MKRVTPTTLAWPLFKPRTISGAAGIPVFRNFVERATYDLNVISKDGRKGYAIGEFLGETDLGGGLALRQYRMGLPLPTYLVGTATSNYAAMYPWPAHGYLRKLPYAARRQTSRTPTQIKASFKYLPERY